MILIFILLYYIKVVNHADTDAGNKTEKGGRYPTLSFLFFKAHAMFINAFSYFFT